MGCAVRWGLMSSTLGLPTSSASIRTARTGRGSTVLEALIRYRRDVRRPPAADRTRLRVIMADVEALAAAGALTVAVSTDTRTVRSAYSVRSFIEALQTERPNVLRYSRPSLWPRSGRCRSSVLCGRAGRPVVVGTQVRPWSGLP